MACTASYQKYRASVTHVLNHLRYPCLEPGAGEIQLEKFISRREIGGEKGLGKHALTLTLSPRRGKRRSDGSTEFTCRGNGSVIGFWSWPGEEFWRTADQIGYAAR
jgi:hypothetical protein